MKISAIAARSSNGVIGIDGGLPWHLPEDLKFFQETTSGHHLIMGRRSFESLGNPLKNRTNIVLTRNEDYTSKGIVIAHSLDRALNYVRQRGEEECFVSGGSKVYKKALPLLDRMYLTEVHTEVEGDTYFPEFDEAGWNETWCEDHPSDDRHPHAFTFRILDKK